MSRILYILLLFPALFWAQEKEVNPHFYDVQWYTGTMLKHNKNVAHLVKAHPQGLILSYNRKTYGENYWQQSYNYPDWGVSFIYQDFNNEVLGQNYGLYGHYNFYFFNRSLVFRIGEGVTYNTNPFDIDTNFKNNAYGSTLVASTYLLFNYNKPRIYNRFGMRAGVSFVHHSNGSFKSPNSGTNVVGINVGVTYDVDGDLEKTYKVQEIDTKSFAEKIKFNFVLKGGLNEGDIIGLGQQPFAVLTAFADKRLNYQSTIQFGTELFLSKFLQKEIEYRAASFQSSTLTGDEDYKRVGVFVGHEFRLGDFAIPTQLGYYLYWPYEYELRVYTRIGVKYYFTEKLFAVGMVKTHAANAEAIEFGLGIRL